MLRIQEYKMTLTGDTWHQVVDETNAVLGGMPDPGAAGRYKKRLEDAGIDSAAAMLSRIQDPARRQVMKEIMCSTI